MTSFIHLDNLRGIPAGQLDKLHEARSAFVARDVFSVVRDSRMWCPHDIGRDSWVWGEQETLWMMNSPHEVGEEPLTERSPLSGDSVPWNGGVMVVESYYFFKNNYC